MNHAMICSSCPFRTLISVCGPRRNTLCCTTRHGLVRPDSFVDHCYSALRAAVPTAPRHFQPHNIASAAVSPRETRREASPALVGPRAI